ncbi:hypothetical protein chiPu_0022006, partial [Chiloscyllium punctatum]|nr:hypothetical protein [Chiloscyllium punctatum]
VAQDAIANKVTNTALTLSGPMKPEKYHNPKEGTVFAALQTGRRKGTEDNCAPARNSKP